jgi:hypothetical protein
MSRYVTICRIMSHMSASVRINTSHHTAAKLYIYPHHPTQSNVFQT